MAQSQSSRWRRLLLTGLVPAALAAFVAAEEPVPQQKPGDRTTEALPSSRLTAVPDVDFAEFFDATAFEAAVASGDIAGMTDIAVSLAEGEKKLGRPHNAVKAADLIAGVGRMAGTEKDGPALERLAAAAKTVGESELAARLTSAAALAKKSRGVGDVTFTLDGTTEQEFRIAKLVAGDIAHARIMGLKGEFKTIAAYIMAQKGYGVLTEATAKGLQARLAAAEAEVAAEGTDPIVEKLGSGSRGYLDSKFKQIFGISSPPKIKATKSTPLKPNGPQLTGSKFLTFGSHKVKLIAEKLTGADFTVSSLNKKARERLKAYANTNTHAYDDTWYRMNLPENGTAFLFLVAGDDTDGTMGWVAVRNSPKRWDVLYYNNKSYSPKNGDQTKEMIKLNGKRVDFDIFNPYESDGYSTNDIWYSFGY